LPDQPQQAVLSIYIERSEIFVVIIDQEKETGQLGAAHVSVIQSVAAFDVLDTEWGFYLPAYSGGKAPFFDSGDATSPIFVLTFGLSHM
jgi:hypothetical protein